jgi:hypothetical protein
MTTPDDPGPQRRPWDGDPQDADPRDGDPRDGDPRDGDPRDGDPRDGDPRDGEPLESMQGDDASGARRDGARGVQDGPRGDTGARASADVGASASGGRACDDADGAGPGESPSGDADAAGIAGHASAGAGAGRPGGPVSLDAGAGAGAGAGVGVAEPGGLAFEEPALATAGTEEIPSTPASPDRVYRSGAGIAGGVLLLVLVAWLGIDALVRGQGRTPWLALATLLLLVPLVSSFTLRPAVYANDERLRIRNPFRTITLPWASVAALRSGYSNEVVVQSGTKYQLWAIPVSLRARKKAGREQLRATSAESGRRGGGLFGPSRARNIPGAFGGPGNQANGRAGGYGPVRAQADRAMDELRELAGTHADAPRAQGAPEVNWSYEVVAPALAGLVLLVVLLGVG